MVCRMQVKVSRMDWEAKVHQKSILPHRCCDHLRIRHCSLGSGINDHWTWHMKQLPEVAKPQVIEWGKPHKTSCLVIDSELVVCSFPHLMTWGCATSSSWFMWWSYRMLNIAQELPWLEEFILTFASVDRNKHCHVCFLNQNIRGLKLYKFTFYLIGYS